MLVNGTFESYNSLLLTLAPSDCGYKAVSAIDGCTLGVLGKMFVVTYAMLEVVKGGLSVHA